MVRLLKQTNYHIDHVQMLQIIGSIQEQWSNQLAITSRSGNDLLDGVGSINEYPGVEEKDFNKLNHEFVGSSIDTVLNQLYKDGYKHGRVRAMRMKPKSVYSWHMDCEPRLHFALLTNPGSMIIVDDQVFTIPVDGYGYWVDTTQYHTALNAGTTDRIHIVIDLIIPVKKLGSRYKLLNTIMDQSEFDSWLLENKPPTEPIRQDFYFE